MVIPLVREPGRSACDRHFKRPGKNQARDDQRLMVSDQFLLSDQLPATVMPSMRSVGALVL